MVNETVIRYRKVRVVCPTPGCGTILNVNDVEFIDETPDRVRLRGLEDGPQGHLRILRFVFLCHCGARLKLRFLFDKLGRPFLDDGITTVFGLK